MQKTVPFIYYTVFIAYFKLYELLYLLYILIITYSIFWYIRKPYSKFTSFIKLTFKSNISTVKIYYILNKCKSNTTTSCLCSTVSFYLRESFKYKLLIFFWYSYAIIFYSDFNVAFYFFNIYSNFSTFRSKLNCIT